MSRLSTLVMLSVLFCVPISHATIQDLERDLISLREAHDLIACDLYALYSSADGTLGFSKPDMDYMVLAIGVAVESTRRTDLLKRLYTAKHPFFKNAQFFETVGPKQFAAGQTYEKVTQRVNEFVFQMKGERVLPEFARGMYGATNCARFVK